MYIYFKRGECGPAAGGAAGAHVPSAVPRRAA